MKLTERNIVGVYFKNIKDNKLPFFWRTSASLGSLFIYYPNEKSYLIPRRVPFSKLFKNTIRISPSYFLEEGEEIIYSNGDIIVVPSGKKIGNVPRKLRRYYERSSNVPRKLRRYYKRIIYDYDDV